MSTAKQLIESSSEDFDRLGKLRADNEAAAHARLKAERDSATATFEEKLTAAGMTPERAFQGFDYALDDFYTSWNHALRESGLTPSGQSDDYFISRMRRLFAQKFG